MTQKYIHNVRLAKLKPRKGEEKNKTGHLSVATGL
jgi:hypothetical protein